MAWTAKLTFTRGEPYSGDIAITAGSAEASHDVISVNIDAANLTKGEALIAIDNIKDAIFAGDWPIN